MADGYRRQVRVTARIFRPVEQPEVDRGVVPSPPSVTEAEPEVQIPRSPIGPEDTVSWETLFDRAAAFDVDEDTIRDRLAELRDD